MNIFFKKEPKYTLTLLHYICITVLAAVAAYYFFVPETPKQRGVVLSKEARAMLFTQQESGALFVAPQNRVEMCLREQPASISEAEAKIDTTPLVCFEPSCTFRSSEEISDFQNELHRKRALGQTPRLDDLNIYARFRLFGNHALDADFVRRLMEEFNTLDPVGGRSTVFARLQDRGIIEESVLQSMIPGILKSALERKDDEILFRVAYYHLLNMPNEPIPTTLHEFALRHPDTSTAKTLLTYFGNLFSDEELRAIVISGGEKGMRGAYQELIKRGSAPGIDKISASYFDEMNALWNTPVESLPAERWDGVTRRYLSLDNWGVPEREQAFKFILSAGHYSEGFLIWQDLHKRDHLFAEQLLPKLLAVDNYDLYRFSKRVEAFKRTGKDPGG